MPAHSILGAPSLFLNRSVVTTIGPRFSFIKDCLPDCTTKWAPTTILRSSDEVTANFNEVLCQFSLSDCVACSVLWATYLNRLKFNTTAVMQNPGLTLRVLCWQDFCELTEAPLEQYAIYKKQWKEANGKRFQAKI